MLTRRLVLASSAAMGALGVIPALAQSADRPNPMPEELRRALEREPSSPVLGNPNGDITLTEFFDYNCPHCKTMVGTMQQLVSSDPQLRVVLREWPVFGPGSEFAAKVSLAALDQKKYWQLHSALLTMKDRAEEPSVMRAVRSLGLDEAKLRADMDSQRVTDNLANTSLLADHMGLMGTPTFICGDEAYFGELSLSELRELVARGRETLGVA